MVTKSEKLTATKRFGSRYGRTVRYKFIEIEREQRKLHKCPYCNKVAVKRLSVGIWHCRKCNSKFTGKAYSVKEKIVPMKEKAEIKTAKEAPELSEKAAELQESAAEEK